MINKFSFVAGSAHLDVLAKATGDNETIDRIGQVQIEIGGAACNLATNLAALGARPRLMTAMPEKSPYTGIITEHLRLNSVDVRLVHNAEMHTAVFSAHIGSNGEMISAISSMPVETAVFTVKQIRSAMEGCCCAILECNLSGETLNTFSQVAFELGIPIYVASVSEEKSLRLLNIKYPIKGIFMNKREALYLSRKAFDTDSIAVIQNHFACSVIVTCGARGVEVLEHRTRKFIPSIEVNRNVNTLGAGDALMASVIFNHQFHSKSIIRSVQQAVIFAAEILSRHNCNSSKEHAIEHALNNLDRMATRDQMTGLLNRRAAETILSEIHDATVGVNTSYSVLMVDIDHFKRVNDTFGHDAGDEAIKSVANILQGTLRSNDSACRWGGEEFLCLLNDADEMSAGIVAERIRKTVSLCEIPTVGFVTVSIGLATLKASDLNANSVVKAADLGLYVAKNQGRNQVGIYQLKIAA